MIDLQAMRAFVAALTGSPETVMDWRALHDAEKGAQGFPYRGTIDQVAGELDRLNTAGYGIFVVVNALDGVGRDAVNVTSIRANFIDYDIPDPNWSQWRALATWDLPPTFSVVGAVPGKFHAYWIEAAWAVDQLRFETLQRKLSTVWSSDRKVIDTPRVMRVPGTAHMKDPSRPVMVTMLPGSGVSYTVEQLEWVLQNVQGETGSGAIERKALDDPETKAPSFDVAVAALDRINPGTLGRDDWLKITAAFKTASRFDGQEDAQRAAFDAWCARYPANDLAENDKLWRSIRDTKTGGWPYLEKVSGFKVARMFSEAPTGTGKPDAGTGAATTSGKAPSPTEQVTTPTGATVEQPTHTLDYASSPFLTPDEQVKYFAGCVLISSLGRILTPDGRYMDATKFNADYGGKSFVLDNTGKTTTDEPWRAATRGQVYRIAKVDHTRFLPTKGHLALVPDDFGRKGVNTYKPPVVRRVKGDPTPFIKWLAALLPDERDQEIMLTVFRHNVQRPGRKMFWAPLIQSEEGAGKGLVKVLMNHALGSPYVHEPNASELIESGGRFTGWMKEKLLIICDEIRVAEKLDMVEKLKPMITEERIEIQGKGADQVMEDNVANWIFFSNWKDAIPVNRNSRRYAIFYSAIQSPEDLEARGMSGEYFPRMFAWMKGDGAAIVTDWLLRTPIAAEFDPMGLAHRAPVTSSKNEAIIQSRGRVEQIIAQAVDEGVPGFRGGWLSSVRLAELLKSEGVRVSPHALSKAFVGMGYHLIGRTGILPDENYKQPNVYSLKKTAEIFNYPIDQGYMPR